MQKYIAIWLCLFVVCLIQATLVHAGHGAVESAAAVAERPQSSKSKWPGWLKKKKEVKQDTPKVDRQSKNDKKTSQKKGTQSSASTSTSVRPSVHEREDPVSHRREYDRYRGHPFPPSKMHGEHFTPTEAIRKHQGRGKSRLDSISPEKSFVSTLPPWGHPHEHDHSDSRRYPHYTQKQKERYSPSYVTSHHRPSSVYGGSSSSTKKHSKYRDDHSNGYMPFPPYYSYPPEASPSSSPESSHSHHFVRQFLEHQGSPHASPPRANDLGADHDTTGCLNGIGLGCPDLSNLGEHLSNAEQIGGAILKGAGEVGKHLLGGVEGTVDCMVGCIGCLCKAGFPSGD
jgi:hypothetical protein